jgi:hypothetical protein
VTGLIPRHLPSAAAIFGIAFAVRWAFLSGLILCDDIQEYSALLSILGHGPAWADQLHMRFAGWLPNYVAFLLFGVSETAFLLPTWILSSTLGVLAYGLLARWGYPALLATLGGILVATAPFEVVLGTLRANDLYLAWALGVGFTFLVLLEERPVAQGVALAVCFWFGFYVKLWAVFVLPALGAYWLLGRRWRAAAAFAGTSAILHGVTCVFWKLKLGTFFPFIGMHGVTYPVPLQELGRVLLLYPKLLFAGSEFGTTLFGAVPYLLLALLLVKTIATLVHSRAASLRLDRADGHLVAFWASLFLFLEFFPTGFKLDAYYSVPRIFRYLAPLSFPMALHVAKMLLDVVRSLPTVAAAAVVASVLALNLWQSAEATGPGRVYRENLLAVIQDVRRAAPPKLVADGVIGGWIRDLYLDSERDSIDVVSPQAGVYSARQHEAWLRERAPSWPHGTMLVTGLGSCIHYGGHGDGFRLAGFEKPLAPSWTLAQSYGVLSYLPRPEPARLWRLESSAQRGRLDADAWMVRRFRDEPSTARMAAQGLAGLTRRRGLLIDLRDYGAR